MNTHQQTHGPTSPVVERARFVPGVGWQRPAKRTQTVRDASEDTPTKANPVEATDAPISKGKA
jgi:hypothetical protein